MLVLAFFGAVFSSVSWLIYSLMYVNSQLAEEHLLSQNLSTVLMFLSVVLIPILIIWMIFGYINQFLINRGMQKKQSELLVQLQKNQDYTDLVVRVMLDAEHEIKDGFVLNKFDTFISDMNEALGEIIQRCNIASSAQIEQLWQRVRRGERWTLGKAILEASKNQSTFNAWVKEKVSRDSVFRGSLLEFCSRYQNLLQLLEKHDRDRIFVQMVESGVFGKVYTIMAPMSESIIGRQQQDQGKVNSGEAISEYASALKLATMEEPDANENIANVDKNYENEKNEIEYENKPKESFFTRMNPFRKKEEYAFEDSENDPFFQALHNSFHGSSSRDERDDFPSFSEDRKFDEPQISMEDEVKDKDIEEEKEAPQTFGHLRETLDSIKANNVSSHVQPDNENEELFVSRETIITPTNKIEPSLSNEVSLNSERDDSDDDNLVYPFGGWTDENNYNK